VFIIGSAKVRSYEKGLYFKDREFMGLLGAGRHWFLDPLGKVKVDVVSQRDPWLSHKDLDVIIKSGALKDEAVVLPGDMKTLLNKVIEAKKASEANLIARREETAAIRSQMNTAKLMQDNPSLMRLRELEVLERVAGHSNLKVILGEKGLADRIVNLI
jgi:hypothetical protein